MRPLLLLPLLPLLPAGPSSLLIEARCGAGWTLVEGTGSCVLRPIERCACLSMFGVDRNRRMLGSASAGWCFVWSPWGLASRWALVVLLCLLVRVRWHHAATDATANPPRRRTLASTTHAVYTKPLGPLIGMERRAARLQGSASSIEGALFNAWRHPGVIDPSLLLFTNEDGGESESERRVDQPVRACWVGKWKAALVPAASRCKHRSSGLGSHLDGVPIPSERHDSIDECVQFLAVDGVPNQGASGCCFDAS